MYFPIPLKGGQIPSRLEKQMSIAGRVPRVSYIALYFLASPILSSLPHFSYLPSILLSIFSDLWSGREITNYSESLLLQRYLVDESYGLFFFNNSLLYIPFYLCIYTRHPFSHSYMKCIDIIICNIILHAFQIQRVQYYDFIMCIAFSRTLEKS